MNPKLDAI